MLLMKNRMRRFLEYLGFVLMLVGVAGVDGEDYILAIIFSVLGLAILYTSAKENIPTNADQAQ